MSKAGSGDQSLLAKQGLTHCVGSYVCVRRLVRRIRAPVCAVLSTLRASESCPVVVTSSMNNVSAAHGQAMKCPSEVFKRSRVSLSLPGVLWRVCISIRSNIFACLSIRIFGNLPASSSVVAARLGVSYWAGGTSKSHRLLKANVVADFADNRREHTEMFRNTACILIFKFQITPRISVF